MGRKSGNKKIRDDSYTKIYAIFKCENADCGKTWSSFHGWKTISNYVENCGNCSNNAKGKVTSVEEKMTEVDVYVCLEGGCHFSWNTLPSKALDKPCPKCSNPVEKSGQQERHAKTVTFICENKSCEKSWSSLFFGKEYTQKCRKCMSKGKFVGKKEMDPNDPKNNQPTRNPWFMLQSGQHDVDNCDMCQELRALGKTQTCRGNRQIEVKEIVLADGRLESVVNFKRGRANIPSDY